MSKVFENAFNTTAVLFPHKRELFLYKNEQLIFHWKRLADLTEIPFVYNETLEGFIVLHRKKLQWSLTLQLESIVNKDFNTRQVPTFPLAFGTLSEADWRAWKGLSL